MKVPVGKDDSMIGWLIRDVAPRIVIVTFLYTFLVGVSAFGLPDVVVERNERLAKSFEPMDKYSPVRGAYGLVVSTMQGQLTEDMMKAGEKWITYFDDWLAQVVKTGLTHASNWGDAFVDLIVAKAKAELAKIKPEVLAKAIMETDSVQVFFSIDVWKALEAIGKPTHGIWKQLTTVMDVEKLVEFVPDKERFWLVYACVYDYTGGTFDGFRDLFDKAVRLKSGELINFEFVHDRWEETWLRTPNKDKGLRLLLRWIDGLNDGDVSIPVFHDSNIEEGDVVKMLRGMTVRQYADGLNSIQNYLFSNGASARNVGVVSGSLGFEMGNQIEGANVSDYF